MLLTGGVLIVIGVLLLTAETSLEIVCIFARVGWTDVSVEVGTGIGRDTGLGLIFKEGC